jgi:hypothetical protein
MRPYLLAITITAAAASPAAAETVVSFSPRGNQAQFFALKNQAANPVGSVVLLAGGLGRLDIKANGTFTFLKYNQVVRTRARYALHGLTTVLPDIAADFKSGASDVVMGYRATAAYAQDVGAVVVHLRILTGKPVIVMGTSRGSIGAANAVAKLAGPPRPDGAVLTSAFLKPGPPLTVRTIVNDDPNLLDIPMMAVINIHDKCPPTDPGEFAAFAAWYAGNGRKLGGGSLNPNIKVDVDDCEARTPHGFWGWDDIVALNLSNWIKLMIAGL